jgi:hypothetical protein
VHGLLEAGGFLEAAGADGHVVPLQRVEEQRRPTPLTEPAPGVLVEGEPAQVLFSLDVSVRSYGSGSDA